VTLEGATDPQYFGDYWLSDAIATATPLFGLPDEGAVVANKHFIPVMVALAVAIIGSFVLFGMDFGHKTAIHDDGIMTISREALLRAGAIATPTAQNE
jgi:hypothetical protein